MIYVHRSEQRSFPEYIDMVFKELTLIPEDEKQIPITDSDDLLYFINDGYWPEFCDVPRWFDDPKSYGVSQRRVKKLAKKIFKEYGEPEKVKEIEKQLEKKWDEQDKAWDFIMGYANDGGELCSECKYSVPEGQWNHHCEVGLFDSDSKDCPALPEELYP